MAINSSDKVSVIVERLTVDQITALYDTMSLALLSLPLDKLPSGNPINMRVNNFYNWSVMHGLFEFCDGDWGNVKLSSYVQWLPLNKADEECETFFDITPELIMEAYHYIMGDNNE